MGTRSAGEIPNITGEISYDGTNTNVGLVARSAGAGALYGKTNVPKTLNVGATDSSSRAALGFDASRSNPLYGAYGGVLPRSLFVKMIIKY